LVSTQRAKPSSVLAKEWHRVAVQERRLHLLAPVLVSPGAWRLHPVSPLLQCLPLLASLAVELVSSKAERHLAHVVRAAAQLFPQAQSSAPDAEPPKHQQNSSVLPAASRCPPARSSVRHVAKAKRQRRKHQIQHRHRLLTNPLPELDRHACVASTLCFCTRA